jgi:hypothetical protein
MLKSAMKILTFLMPILFLLTACVSKPDLRTNIRENGTTWNMQVRGFTPVMRQYYYGNMVYTPKPGYHFFMLHVQGEPLDKPRDMYSLNFHLLTSLGEVLSPQFREAIGFTAQPGTPKKINYVFIVSERDLPAYVILPSGAKIDLAPILTPSKTNQTAYLTLSLGDRP